MLKRMTIEEKKRAAKILGAPDRPLNHIIELTKPNGSPDYKSDTLRERSKATAKARGARFSRVARKMAAQN